MGQSLLIQRKSAAITLAEWKQAVAAIPQFRLATSDTILTNPKTGASVLIPHRDGDVEVQFSDGQWLCTIQWYIEEGCASFRLNCMNDPKFKPAILQLARALNAEITGEGFDYPHEGA